MNPLVSILIPLYNSETSIKESIESALNQTYHNIEIIIVDDGSKDNSYDIATSFASDNVIVVRQSNQGACAARNHAFKLSRGTYIQYLDADDLLEEDKIFNQIETLSVQRNKNTLVFGPWKEFSKFVKDGIPNHLSIYKNYSKPLELLADMWCTGEFVAAHAWLTPRNLIEEAGPWDESLRVNQDGEFFCRILLKADKVIFTESVSYYRKGIPNSVSNSRFKPEKVKSLLDSDILYESHVEKYKDEEKVRRGLANNYYYFIYTYYHLFPELVKVARRHAEALGMKPNLKTSGGKNFRKLSRWLGYYNVLKLRKLLYRLGIVKK